MGGIADGVGAPGIGDAAKILADVRDAVIAFRMAQDSDLLATAVERIALVVGAPGFGGLDTETQVSR
jgi:hypothetical protein